MLCGACGAAVDVTDVFPGGAVSCAACGHANPVAVLPVPSDAASPASAPYRTPDARSREVGLIVCPFCGAPCSPDVRACPHCDVCLANVRCAHCFTLHFTGSRYCTRCSKELELEPLLDATDAPCPRCDKPLGALPDAEPGMHECLSCGGIFLDHRRLAEIVRQHDASGPLPERAPFAPVAARPVVPDTVRYIKCPLCHVQMNRTNFGKHSGIIVDVCKTHGTWFDGGELTQAVEFVARGGIEMMRRREREKADEQWREQNVAAVLSQRGAIAQPDDSWSTRAALTTGFVEALIEGLLGL